MGLKLVLGGLAASVLGALWFAHGMSEERTKREQAEAAVNIQRSQADSYRLAYENQAVELEKAHRIIAAYKSEKRTVRVRLPDGTVYTTTDSLIDLDEQMQEWTKGKNLPLLPPEPPPLPWSPPWKPLPGPVLDRPFTVGAGVDLSGWSTFDPVGAVGYQTPALWIMAHGGFKTAGLTAGVRF